MGGPTVSARNERLGDHPVRNLGQAAWKRVLTTRDFPHHLRHRSLGGASAFFFRSSRCVICTFLAAM